MLKTMRRKVTSMMTSLLRMRTKVRFELGSRMLEWVVV